MKNKQLNILIQVKYIYKNLILKAIKLYLDLISLV